MQTFEMLLCWNKRKNSDKHLLSDTSEVENEIRKIPLTLGTPKHNRKCCSGVNLVLQLSF